jgi:hypothetical protein
MFNHADAMNFEQAIAFMVVDYARGRVPRLTIDFQDSPLPLVKHQKVITGVEKIGFTRKKDLWLPRAG